MLLKESDKGYFTFVVPISCHLVSADRSTGEVLRTNIHKHLYVPMMREAMEAFDIRSEHTTADRASANARAEASLAWDFKWPRQRLPCCAHIASTAQG